MKCTAWGLGHSPAVSSLVSLVLRPVAECVQMRACSKGRRACVCAWRRDSAKEPRGMQPVLSRVCLPMHQWFGVEGSAGRAADCRSASTEQQQESLWWLIGAVCLGEGGAGSGGGLLGGGGRVSNGSPFAPSSSHPLQSRASALHRHQWSQGGGRRREEAGTRGWSGGEEEEKEGG